MENNIKKIKALFDKNNFMTLATASLSGEPWVSVLTFAYNEEFHIYWCSQNISLHSQNIEENPFVAISIMDWSSSDEKEFPIVYIKAVAQLVSKDILDKVLKSYDERIERIFSSVGVNPDDAITNFPLKMYMAIPEKMYTLKGSELEYNKWIDCRVPIDFHKNEIS